MLDPYFIQSSQLEDVLEQSYGLYHRANRTNVWTLADLLQPAYSINQLEHGCTSIGQQDIDDLIVPIHGVVAVPNTPDTGFSMLVIPESNMHQIQSMYLTDTDQWLIWLQSKQTPTYCWAWEITMRGLTNFHCHIVPCNTAMREAGWHIQPNQALQAHITQWSSTKFDESMQQKGRVPAWIM